MKFTRKNLFTTIALFTFLALIPMGCDLFCTDSCGCGSSVLPKDFLIESFSVLTVNESGTELQQSETFSFEEVFKAVRIKEVQLTSQKSTEFLNHSAFGTAFACSPLPPMSKNTLYQIQILNQKEFTLNNGTTYFEGDDITPLIGINHFFSAGLKTIENFMEPGWKLSYDDYFKFGFLNNPEKELNLEFTIRFVFDDTQEILIADQKLNIR